MEAKATTATKIITTQDPSHLAFLSASLKGVASDVAKTVFFKSDVIFSVKLSKTDVISVYYILPTYMCGKRQRDSSTTTRKL